MCKKKIIAIYSLAHFLVDMSCAMLLYHLLYAGTKNSDSVSLFFSASFIILIYDFFAFVFELPLGLIRVFSSEQTHCPCITKAFCFQVQLSFSDTSLIAGCIVLFLFNMTMPIAMIGLANLMPAWKGVAFGLNTTALFLGFIS